MKTTMRQVAAAMLAAIVAAIGFLGLPVDAGAQQRQDPEPSTCQFDGCDCFQTRSFRVNLTDASAGGSTAAAGYPLSSCTSWNGMLVCTTQNATISKQQPGVYAIRLGSGVGAGPAPRVAWASKQVVGTDALPLLDLAGDSFSVDGLALFGANADGVPLGLPVVITPFIGPVHSMTGTTNNVMLIPSKHKNIAAYLTNGVPHASIWLNDTIQGQQGTFTALHTPVVFSTRAIFMTQFHAAASTPSQPLPPPQTTGRSSNRTSCRLYALDVKRSIAGRLSVPWFVDTACPASFNPQTPPALLGMQATSEVCFAVPASPTLRFQRGKVGSSSSSNVTETEIKCVSSMTGNATISSLLQGIAHVHSFCRFSTRVTTSASDHVFALASSSRLAPADRILMLNATTMEVLASVPTGLAPAPPAADSTGNATNAVNVSPLACIVQLEDEDTRGEEGAAMGERLMLAFSSATEKTPDRERSGNGAGFAIHLNTVSAVSFDRVLHRLLGSCEGSHTAQLVGVSPSYVGVPCSDHVFVTTLE